MFKRILFTSALLMGMVVCLSGPAFSATLFVKPGTPGAFGTIQKAIDAAAPGDTILISALPSNRAYNETIVVDKNNIILKGSVSYGMCRADIYKVTQCIVDNLGELVTLADGWEDCCSPVILDACDAESCMKTAITITAPNVTVEKLTIRHAEPGIRLEEDADNAVIKNSCFFDYKEAISGINADKVMVSDCIFFGGDSRSIYLYYGNNATVTKNRFRTVGSGIRIWGKNAVVDTNTFLNCNVHAIDLRLADNAIVRNNCIQGADDAVSIIGGNNVLVTNNRIKAADNGIYITSDYLGNNYGFVSTITNPVVANNYIEGGEEGIRVSPYQRGTNPNPTIRNNIVKYTENEGILLSCSDCTSGVIEYNKVSYALVDEECMEIRGVKNLIIQNNVIEYCSQDGLLYVGDNGIIKGNTVRFCGSESRTREPGITIDGSNNLVEKNTASKNSFDGILNDGGDNNIYRENTLNQNGMSGICINFKPYVGDAGQSNDNSIEKNIIKSNYGEGINIGENSFNTNTINNYVTGNKTDICNEGTSSTFFGNIYYTGGPNFDCVVR